MGGKLLILANNSLGLYRFRADLIRTLGQTYTVYASTPRNDHFDDLASIGCHVIETGIDRRGLNPIRDLRLLRTYRRLIREIRPDLVITYTIKCNVWGGCSVCGQCDRPGERFSASGAVAPGGDLPLPDRAEACRGCIL